MDHHSAVYTAARASITLTLDQKRETIRSAIMAGGKDWMRDTLGARGHYAARALEWQHDRRSFRRIGVINLTTANYADRL